MTGTYPNRGRPRRNVPKPDMRPGWLRRELQERGWTPEEFALVAGLSRRTVNAATAGRPVHPGTVEIIRHALEAHPPLATLAAAS